MVRWSFPSVLVASLPAFHVSHKVVSCPWEAKGTVMRLLNQQYKDRRADLIDGTPILDIKPYIPYSDAIREATDGFAAGPPKPRLQVRMSRKAEEQLAARADGNQVRQLIIACIETDPRPAYRHGEDGEYGFRLFDFDLQWRVTGSQATVLELRGP